ncbi:hypothetical protein HYQ46_010370 [Verticillium longisporum]|nr:hypothetical protein HYQ46_010370 [Verticillium longisporum]
MAEIGCRGSSEAAPGHEPQGARASSCRFCAKVDPLAGVTGNSEPGGFLVSDLFEDGTVVLRRQEVRGCSDKG